VSVTTIIEYDTSGKVLTVSQASTQMEVDVADVNIATGTTIITVE
jgi:hypothetical protein